MLVFINRMLYSNGWIMYIPIKLSTDQYIENFNVTIPSKLYFKSEYIPR